ncbi:hypothetical protein [Exiguobacterium sp. s155]|uniref:hypothetical protein n=1 Tax=Exiguobacterium sp. s155 TaxID=2751286 RepID=UPI001BE5F166|nr:hypothetical protein [Exiguobacterium sp. s155]
MNQDLFLEMERVFRKPFDLDAKGAFTGLGGILNAGMLRGGYAYAGLVATLSPLYQSARENNDVVLENMINKVLDDHSDLSDLDSQSKRYIELSESAIKVVRELYVMNK